MQTLVGKNTKGCSKIFVLLVILVRIITVMGSARVGVG